MAAATAIASVSGYPTLDAGRSPAIKSRFEQLDRLVEAGVVSVTSRLDRIFAFQIVNGASSLAHRAPVDDLLTRGTRMLALARIVRCKDSARQRSVFVCRLAGCDEAELAARLEAAIGT